MLSLKRNWSGVTPEFQTLINISDGLRIACPVVH